MSLNNTMLNFLAQDPAQGSGTGPIVMMVLMFAMMYFLIIRPQRRQRKEHEARIAALRTGDEVVTTGGIYGIITNVKDLVVVLTIADNVRIKVDKSCVANVLKKSDEPEDETPTVVEADSIEKA